MRNDARRTANIIHVPYPLIRATWAAWSYYSRLQSLSKPRTLENAEMAEKGYLKMLEFQGAKKISGLGA